MVAFRNDEYLWWQVAEYTYDTFMIRARTRSLTATAASNVARGSGSGSFFFGSVDIP